jgi:hypothetical protein
MLQRAIMLIALAIWLIGIGSVVLDMPVAGGGPVGACLLGWGVLWIVGRRWILLVQRTPKFLNGLDLPVSDESLRAIYLGWGVITVAGGLLLMSKSSWIGFVHEMTRGFGSSR